MTSQRRTIMGACDYSIATLKQLKKDLSQIGAKHEELNWAIGGIVITLIAQLIQTCDQVFAETAQVGEPNAKQDISEIQHRFNEFVSHMVNHE